MDEQAFSDEMGPILDALRDERGNCSDIGGLLNAKPETLNAEERAAVARHLELCPSCAAANPDAAVVDDLAWHRAAKNLDGRTKPWLEDGRGSRTRSFRRPLLVAATLVIALGAATIWRQFQVETNPPQPVSIQRGAGLQALGPSGVITSPVVFQWQTVVPLELVYRIELAEGDTILWRGETLERTIEPPPEIADRLAPEGAYRWRVLGIDDDLVVAESGWVAFTVSP